MATFCSVIFPQLAAGKMLGMTDLFEGRSGEWHKKIVIPTGA
jgi:hypothetical protein